MMAIQSRQTTAREYMRGLSLPGLVFSPYFQTIDLREEAPGRDITRYPDMIKAFILGYIPTALNADVAVLFEDPTDAYTFSFTYPLGIASGDSATDVETKVLAAIAAFCTTNSVPLPDSYEWLLNGKTSRSFSNPSLAINTARQASTTRDAFVSTSVDITANLTLITGQRGTLTLQYADNNTFTTNVKTAQSSTNGNTGTLTVGLALGQTVSAAVSGIIPAGKYYRLLTTNNTGTPTYGTPQVQEVLL